VIRAVRVLADLLSVAAAIARATAEGFATAERSLSGYGVPCRVPDEWVADHELWVWGEDE